MLLKANEVAVLFVLNGAAARLVQPGIKLLLFATV